MKNVVIFGTGGLAKELIGYLIDNGGYNVLCAVSTQPFSGTAFSHIPVMQKYEGEGEYLLAVSEPWIKRKIVAESAPRWGRFVHKSCYVSPHAKIGRGCILTPQAVLSGDCELGDFVFMNTNATVGHDSVIGGYSTMMPNTEVCGDCAIGEDVFMGIGSYVLPGHLVGTGAKISAGCIVRHNVAAGMTV